MNKPGPIIAQTGFGWITPRNVQIACKPFQHFEGLKDNPEAKPFWESVNVDVQDALRGCEALEAQGEHGEWHNYEMAVDDAQWKLADILFQQGFIRVGTNSHQGTMEFSGKPEAIASKLELCRTVLRHYNEAHERNYTLSTHTKSL